MTAYLYIKATKQKDETLHSILAKSVRHCSRTFCPSMIPQRRIIHIKKVLLILGRLYTKEETLIVKLKNLSEKTYLQHHRQ